MAADGEQRAFVSQNQTIPVRSPFNKAANRSEIIGRRHHVFKICYRGIGHNLL
jgi:hypothetical protein